jgi:GntR family transcriptional repressor for pyruvate dehydrogenase complex
MNYPNIRPRKGYEMVAEFLEKQIREGIYPPGSKLPTVVELAEGFEVGRSTVREALSALKAKGYLEIRHGGGTYVKASWAEQRREDPFVHAESLREVLEVRKYLEIGCAALAAERRTADDLNELGAIVSEMEACLNDKHASEQADVRFHLRIAEASHNALLHQLMQSLNYRLQEAIADFRRLWFYADRSSAEQLLREHQAIFTAIAERDGERAVSLMNRHLTKVESVLRNHL